MLGATLGRREEDWADVGLFGAQITLQLDPPNVPAPMPRTRHFGATMARSEWEALVAGLAIDFVEPPSIGHAGTNREQAKAMIADPSGNLIELKAYRRPELVLPVSWPGPWRPEGGIFVTNLLNATPTVA